MRTQSWKRFLVGAAAAAALAVPGAARAEPTFTCNMTRTGEFPRASPGAVGLDAFKLQQAINFAQVNGSETFKVFRHGCLVGEGLPDALFDFVPRSSWSQTKTVSALIAGIAVDKGYVNLDVPIATYVTNSACDAAHLGVTLRQLLNMSAGHDLNYVQDLNLAADVSRFGEYCSSPLIHAAGTYFEYDQLGPSVVNYVVQRAIWAHEPGVDFQDFAQRELFDWLGIPRSAYFWQRDRSGTTGGHSGLFLRPVEFGRMGELLRTHGRYAGRQIISAWYLQQLASPASSNCGYGFFVWRNGCQAGQMQVDASIFQRHVVEPGPWIASAPSDMYFSWGMHGQHVFVIPSLDMIITRSGEVPLDAESGAVAGDPDAVIAGQQRAGYHELFRLLMQAVNDMPAEVAATIANPGPYNGSGPSLNVDPSEFLFPLTAAPGSYLVIGPRAPVGCTLLGCSGESNDGLLWLTEVPPTVLGILRLDARPNGN